MTLIPLWWTPLPWQAVALSLLVLIWAGSEVLYRLHGGIKSASDGISSQVIGAAMLFNIVMMIALGATHTGAIGWNAAPIATAGLIVATGGTALRYSAILTLGRFFTSAVLIRQDHDLVRHGPFRLIRHPGYTGVLLFGLGIGLTLANPLAAGLYVLTQGAALLYRIGVEERVMRESFGEQYDTWSQSTKRLIPFVY